MPKKTRVQKPKKPRKAKPSFWSKATGGRMK